VITKHHVSSVKSVYVAEFNHGHLVAVVYQVKLVCAVRLYHNVLHYSAYICISIECDV